MSFIFVIITLRPIRFHWERDKDIAEQLTWSLVVAQERDKRIIRSCILIQNIFHMPDIISRDLSNTPALVQPRF